MPDGFLTAFLSWQFAATCIAISAIIAYLKRLVAAAAPELLERHWFKAVLVLQNLVWGVVAAVPHGFLLGERFSERVVLGICAGYVSQTVYQAFLKRILGAPAGAAPAEGAVPSGEIDKDAP